MLNKNRKAQEEMMGFVLIVVLVMIIFIVFLVISFNSKQKVSENTEIDGFLSSIQEYTSPCAGDYATEFLSLRGIIAYCRDGKMCFDPDF